MDVDWNAVFGLSVAPAELIVRGTAMYLFLWTLFRVVIKRRIGSIGMADLLVLVIIADASQNAMPKPGNRAIVVPSPTYTDHRGVSPICSLRSILSRSAPSPTSCR